MSAVRHPRGEAAAAGLAEDTVRPAARADRRAHESGSSADSDLVSVLERRAAETPDFIVYHALSDDLEIAERIDFAGLQLRARAVAVTLDRWSQRGDRVLLLFPAGIDFSTAFMGCLYSGRLAVPLPPPSASRLYETAERLLAIAAVAEPAVAITTRALLNKLAEYFDSEPALGRFRWLAVEDVADADAASWRPNEIEPERVAFLQFTSGSTAAPKGVMLTHANLMHNLHSFDEAGAHDADCRILTWLPPFHDFGLIYGLLAPVFCGVQGYILSSAAFVQRPARWVQAMSRYRITHSMGPNFAFDLCTDTIRDDVLRDLDLSRVRGIGNGAEPVRMDTMRRFAARFAAAGLRLSALSPGWGLAEAACIVTSRHHGRSTPGIEPRELILDAAALAQGRVVLCEGEGPGRLSAAGSGRPLGGTDLRIVDPRTCLPCASDRVGEIWISNGAVSAGYWNNPKRTDEVFGARIAAPALDAALGPFLRTGDLGFVNEDELFVTGRIKDVLILRGQNHYPQDIELTVDRAHPLLKHDGAAAFAIRIADEERLGIAVEVDRRFKSDEHADEVLAAVRSAVAERHALQPAAIALVRTRTIPKTTSGKIQRAASRNSFLARKLTLRGEWFAPGVREALWPQDDAGPVRPADHGSTQYPSPLHGSAQELRAWLRDRVAALAGLSAAAINFDSSLGDLGLDSLQSVRLLGEVEERFGLTVPPTTVFDHPSINRLTDALIERLRIEPTPPLSTPPARQADPIAVVGMDCRFPGARDPDALWRLLVAGAQAIQPAPEPRVRLLASLGAASAEALGEAGYIDDIEQFDPEVFKLSPREAEQIDPQQRLLLTSVLRALENALIPLDELRGSRAGVFVGIAGSDYARLALRQPDRLDGHAGTGLAPSIAANRVSYWLDLHGPSLAVDTACSSSLTALHLARLALEAGDCDTAIVGGVNVLLDGEVSALLRRAGMLSASGACHSFGERADGYVRAEGVGVVVLRRLSQARALGNEPLALLASTAVNQDGRSNGLTAPSGQSQQSVLRAALAAAGAAPTDIDYVEAHGTGTPLGDPIEVSALAAVFGAGRDPSAACQVGSIKANIGHLEAAAGIAGFIKAVLCLRHGRVPPLAGFSRRNPRIDFTALGLAVNESKGLILPSAGLRAVGVTSMGFGGTNVHAILRPVPASDLRQDADRGGYLLRLDAERPEDMAPLAAAYARVIEAQPQRWPSVCYHATVGRSARPWRRSIAAASAQEMLGELNRLASSGAADAALRATRCVAAPRVAFVFSGQGSQCPAMARSLYLGCPVFRAEIQACEAALVRRGAPAVAQALWGEVPLDEVALARTEHAQPALFVVEYALARFLLACGVQPVLMIGHSLGEYVAACIAGVLTLDDAIGLVLERARLMAAAPGNGGMCAVTASHEDVQRRLHAFAPALAVAAVNAPRQVVVAGDCAALQTFMDECQRDGVGSSRLAVSAAFHSPLMTEPAEALRRAATAVRHGPPSVPVVGNVNGVVVTDFDGLYWAEHMRRPVQFQRCVQTAVDQGVDLFIEIGAQPVLSAALTATVGVPTPVLSTLSRHEDDWLALSRTFARLHDCGATIDWRCFYAGRNYDRVTLPGYPLRERPCWLGQAGQAGVAVHEAAPPSSPAMASSADRSAVTEVTAAELATLLAPLLGCAADAIDPQATVLELGADSIVLAEFATAISRRYDLELPVAELFDQLSSLERLAEWMTPRVCSRASDHAAHAAQDCASTTPTSSPQSAAASTPGPAEAGRMEEWLRQQLADLLSVDAAAIDLDRRFLDLGADSLVLTQVVTSVAGTFGTEITLTRLFDELSTPRLLLAELGRAVAIARPERLPSGVLSSHAPSGAVTGPAVRSIAAVSSSVDASSGAAVTSSMEALMSRQIAAFEAMVQRQLDTLLAIGASAGAAASAQAPPSRQPAQPSVTLARPSASAFARSSAGPAAAASALNNVARAYAVRALQQLAGGLSPGRRLTLDRLADAAAVVPACRPMLGRLLEIGEEAGVVNRTAEGWAVSPVFVARPRPDSADREIRTLSELAAAHAGAVVPVLDRCGDALVDVLTGRRTPADVLFSGRGPQEMERLYTETPGAAEGIAALTAQIVRVVEEVGRARGAASIVEIGAGTGSATSAIVPALSKRQLPVRYLFSDLSPAFLARAKMRFAAVGWIDYCRLDIERPPEEQGIAAGAFDVAVASNVLHATRDLAQTLAHVRSLLAPGGRIVFLECVQSQPWLDLIFGLTEGWWRGCECPLRKGYPLLEGPAWAAALSAHGFGSVQVELVGESVAEHQAAYQAVVAGERTA